jgi:pathogenesis-related protein 1
MSKMLGVSAFVLLISVTVAQAQYPFGHPGAGQLAAPFPSSAPAGPPASLARAMLEAHNAVRARVGVPPLAWSAQLATGAQNWASRLIATNEFAHQPDDRYGENLFGISGGAASPSQVVAAWADEARGYDIRTDTCAGVCGHYTQIVWRATHTVGCGVASDPEREIWVCEYDPPGNFVGSRPY